MTLSQIRKAKVPGRSATLLAGVAAVLAFGGAVRAADVSASQPTTAELMKQIQDLQSKVQQLSTKQDEQLATNKKDIDATVDQVLRDADKRSQLLQMEGFTAGWEKGRFKIQSADGVYSLMPWFQLQFRNATTYDTAGNGDTQNGFELRRMKFGADGTAFSKDFYYFIDWNTGNGGTNAGNLNLEEAWASYRFADDWGVRAGQFTDPSIHEQNVSSKKQLAVERSLVNQILTGASQVYVQGVTLQYIPKNSPWKAEVGLTDGDPSVDTDFRDEPGNTTDFGATGRVEYTFMGDKADYGQFTARKDKTDLLVAGAGVLFTESGSIDSVIHTADITYDSTSGLSAYGAFLANYVSSEGSDSYNYGILGQVGYVLPDNDQWEVFGRYDWTHLDHAAVIGTSSEDNFHEITIGVNYYMYGHNAKITVDGSWLPNGTTGPTSLDQVPTTDDEFTLRAQFQLLL